MPEIRFSEEEQKALDDVEPMISDRFEVELGRFRTWLNDEEMEAVRKALVTQTRGDMAIQFTLRSLAWKVVAQFGGRIEGVRSFIERAEGESADLIDVGLSESPLWEKLDLSSDDKERVQAVEDEVFERFGVERPFRPVKAGDPSLEGKETVDLGELMKAREAAMQAAGLDEDPSASLMRGIWELQEQAVDSLTEAI